MNRRLTGLVVLLWLAALAFLPTRNTQAYMPFIAFIAPPLLNSCVPGSTWVSRTNVGTGTWRDVKSSLDGTKLVAVKATTNMIYTSTDSGTTWVSRTSPVTGNWMNITMSGDGLNLFATRLSSNILYTSADGGSTWVSRTLPANGNYSGAASSADGSKIVTANGNGGYIYTSSNTGVTWVSRTAPGASYWKAFASSADGTKLVVGDNGALNSGRIYTSADSGVTWTQRTPDYQWADIDSSADGTKIIAGGTISGVGGLYISLDSGVNWTTVSLTSPSTLGINGTAVTADGSKFFHLNSSGYINMSTDNGTTWTTLGRVSTTSGYAPLAINYNGTQLVTAGSSAGYLWTSACATTPGFWATIAQKLKFKAAVPQSGSNFGSSVAISNSTMAVAAGLTTVGAAANAGRVHIFTGSGASWTEQTSITIPSPAASDRAGYQPNSIALEGTTLAIGNVYNKESVYVYTGSGSSWTLQQVVSSTTGAQYNTFGKAIALSGDTLAVGADYSSMNGRIYLFKRTGSAWAKEGEFTGSYEEYLGGSVDIDGDTSVAGATTTNNYKGAAYVYTRSGSTWTQQQVVSATDAAIGDYFGMSVGISSNTLAVGAPYRVSGTGGVYIFTRSGSTWTQQQRLAASDAVSNSGFGMHVKLEGDNLAVTATPTGRPYKIYLFTRDGNTWVEQKKVTAPVSTTDTFASSIALAPDSIVVGAATDDSTSTDSGAAYIYGAP